MSYNELSQSSLQVNGSEGNVFYVSLSTMPDTVIDMIILWLDCYRTANNVWLMLHKPCS